MSEQSDHEITAAKINNIYAGLLLLSITLYWITAINVPEHIAQGLSFWFLLMFLFLIKKDRVIVNEFLKSDNAPSAWWALVAPVYLWKRVGLLSSSGSQKRSARAIILSAGVILPLFLVWINESWETQDISCSEIPNSLTKMQTDINSMGQEFPVAVLAGDKAGICRALSKMRNMVAPIHQAALSCKIPSVAMQVYPILSSVSDAEKEYSCQ